MASPMIPMLPRIGAAIPPWMEPQRPVQGGVPQFVAPPDSSQQEYGNVAPILTPEEESSLLGSVMGGVQYIGETLGKPGAAVTGTLSGLTGGPWGGGLLNLIPFSDTLGITDPQKRVYSRDILERTGMLPQNKPGLNLTDPADVAGDVLGFAGDVLLDPLTWVTGPLGTVARGAGAASKASKAIAAAKTAPEAAQAFKAATDLGAKATTLATTPASIAQQIRAGERGLMGLKVPFAKEPFAVFGAGSERVANLVDKAFYGGGWANPIVHLRAAFSHTAGGVATGLEQRAKDLAYVERQNLKDSILDIAPVFRRDYAALEERVKSIADHFQSGGDEWNFQDFTRAALEDKAGIPQGQQLLDLMGQHMNLPANAPLQQVVQDTKAFADDIYGFLDALKSTEDVAYKRYQALGGIGKDLEDDLASHFGRRGAAEVQKYRELEAKGGLGGRMAFWLGRQDVWRNFPGNTATIDRMFRSQVFKRAATEDDVVLAIADRSHQLNRNLMSDPVILKEVNDAEYAAALKRYQKKHPSATSVPGWTPHTTLDNTISKTQLQEILIRDGYVKPGLDDALAKGTIDQAKYTEHWESFSHQGMPLRLRIKGKYLTKIDPNRTVKMLRAMRNMPDEVHERGLFDKSVVSDWFSYMDSLLSREATLRTAHSFLASPGLIDATGHGSESLVRAWNKAGFGTQGIDTFIAKHYGPQLQQLGIPLDPADKAYLAWRKNLTVDERTATALQKFGEIQKPGKQSEFAKIIDRVGALYKGALTTVWPSFHTRNLGAGVWQSWADGQVSLPQLYDGYKATLGHLRGQPMEFLDEIKNNGVLGHGQLTEILGDDALAAEIPESMFEFLRPLAPSAIRAKGIRRSLNPFAMRGFVDKDAPLNAAGEVGDKLYNLVEFLNRGSYYHALRKAGMTPAQALHHVKRAHLDYSALSGFEKSVMRRAVPFFSFTRKNLPYQIAKILERPGGRTAQTLRALSSPENEEGSYTPNFLREGMAVRVGGSDDAAHFFKQSGLPVEDLNKLQWRGGFLPSLRTLEKFGAMLAPPLLWPIEQYAGRALHSGRELKQLQSPTEALSGTPVPVLDQMAHYLPGSRAVSEFMGVVDPRKTWWQKAMNATTGAKTGTYDVEKWRSIDLQDALKDQLEESPYVSEGQYYMVPDRYKTGAAGQEAQRQIRQVRGLSKIISDLKKKREREGKV